MNTTKRFSNRVANYVRWRPGYPPAVLAGLRERGLWPAQAVVADIGSGTGLSSRLFLAAGGTVYGVEPNPEMRAAGETFLNGYPAFHSVDATAEHTGLADHTMDLVVAAQAFHWFDGPQCQAEFRRILKPGAPVVLIWNDRRTEATDFLRAYEALLQTFGTDYAQVKHQNVDEQALDRFFGKGRWAMFSTDNFQDFDFDGLKGRLLSSSYVPPEDHPDSPRMLAALKRIFTQFQENGTVRFWYDTKVYHGTLS